ncbi:hypothetical protein TRFO_09353 [Tritrichomonas foetus]|uniref:Calcineurin-like phosphoesterase domain-containing protein n=1 Tax=Tritrichomonas foetus TaxID=1144522 RepID=A0A1J4JK51_9EUKA|nr:hypothetical protein TRFO_09353 [Tritrichomonas foetus]|eukprot:OHS97644.1 hypothetical protein TRFO_09353 [Tritrichomonas foetus]
MTVKTPKGWEHPYPELQSRLIIEQAIIKKHKNVRALVITDIHIGYYHDYDNDRMEFLKHLTEVIQKENPTDVFICGDLIHHSRELKDKQMFFSLFREFEKFKIPFWIIPGNHDFFVKFIECCFNEYKGKYVHPIECDILIATDKKNKHKIAFAHDFRIIGNGHRRPGVKWWFTYCKSQKKDFPEGIYFICGHVHQDFDIFEENLSTLSPFCPSWKNYRYGIVSFDKKHGFTFRTNEENSNIRYFNKIQ